jgi:D-cysteine desulfhydrase
MIQDIYFRTPLQLLKFNDGQNTYFIKRDDLLPFSFGGNKVRIAHKYFEDMDKKGFNCIIAYGNSRSNLCRIIANMSKTKGLPCFVISPADESGERLETNNSIIVKAMGAQIIPCIKADVAATVARTMDKCRSHGLNPYYIYGDIYGKGNEKVAVQAYVEAYQEIKEQELALGVHFDYIFLACGTGTTLAGLICGQLNSNDGRNIIGISVARDKKHALSVVSDYIYNYFDDNTNAKPKNSNILIVDDFLSGGYGNYCDGIIQTIKDVLSTDGIALDTTYTGKAFYGMKQYIRNKQIHGKNILFIHTGGTPLFFDNIGLIVNAKIRNEGKL